MTEKENKPKHRIQVGAVNATIWENEIKTDKGNFTKRTVNMQRAYKDKEDKWQHTNTLNVSDIPKAIVALQKAYELIVMNNEEE